MDIRVGVFYGMKVLVLLFVTINLVGKFVRLVVYKDGVKFIYYGK